MPDTPGRRAWVAQAAVAVVLCAAPAATPGLTARGRDDPSARQGSIRPDASLAKSLAEGSTSIEDGRFEEARATFERAIEDARTAGDVRGEAEAYRGLGRARSALREFAASREAYDRALLLFERAGDDSGVGRVWNHLGTDAYLQGRVPEARQYYDRALAVFSKAGLPGEEANILRNQVFLPDRSLDDKLQQIAVAVERARAGGARITEALALHTWGDLLFTRSDYAAAKVKLDEALAILEPAAAGTRGRDLARLYTSLGRLYRVHGDPERALTYYERAFERQRALRDIAGEIQSLNAIALALHVLDRARDAGRRYDEALALARASHSPQTGFILQQMGIFHVDLRHYARGASLLEEALALSPLPAERPRAQATLAKAYASLGRHVEARDMADRAVAAARESGDIDALRSAHYSRAQVALAGGRIASALDDAREALRMSERLRPNLLPTDPLKLGFGERLQDQFGFTVSLMIRAGLAEEAFVVGEQGRSRAFLDLLATHDPNGTADAELRSTVSTQAPSLDQLKDTVARLGSTAISYWVTSTSTFVWVVTSDGIVHGREIQVGWGRLRKLVQATWATQPPSQQRGESQPSTPEDRLSAGGGADRVFRELYETLIQPVRAWLPRGDGTLLTVVPHGPLLRLSFASLLNERGRYLVEGYRLHYTPALSVLAFTASRKVAGRADRVLIVTDPSPPLSLRVAERLLPLPGARREADAIARVSRGASVRKLVGTAAGEASVRAEAGNWTTLHFAAHAVVSDDRPLASYLALAGTSGEADDDGRLTVEEIYDLALHADLVVLSACRTAGGRITGDGIVGLTRAFISAGAPSVIASAWDLSDETTPQLFAAFYLARARGAGTSDALRAAQLQILRALRTGSVAVSTAAGRFTVPEHPSIWGGLQLWGEP